ncbi:MAG TPA: DnaA N-terminal domain-containing protein, partial [Bacteroidota bacterium]
MQAADGIKSVGENNIDTVWKKCLAVIGENINEQSFKTWFEPIVPVGLEENRLTIRVPSQFFYEWLE